MGPAARHDELPDLPRKGRGAISNAAGRYEPHRHARTDDGWGIGDEDAPPLRTTVTDDASRSIIARNTSPDVGFDRSINPYRGCEHGCVYCFARPTHAHLGLSPGLDFESRLFAKPQAAALLRRELARPSYRPATIAMGTNTDPYQPVERRRLITRHILEVLAECEHPVSIVTKSALVLRDLDLLAPMAAKGLARVGVSVTTLDRTLARRMEPRAASPGRRLATLSALADAGVPSMVMVAPVIPGLNDHEMEAILEQAAAAGAHAAGTILLRLPMEIKDLFGEWLQAHYPNRAKRIETLIRDTRRGGLYVDRFGERMRGAGRYAEMLNTRFRLACRRLDLDRPLPPLDTSRFRRPQTCGHQLTLL